jgi:hypothetical protein
VIAAAGILMRQQQIKEIRDRHRSGVKQAGWRSERFKSATRLMFLYLATALATLGIAWATYFLL